MAANTKPKPKPKPSVDDDIDDLDDVLEQFTPKPSAPVPSTSASASSTITGTGISSTSASIPTVPASSFPAPSSSSPPSSSAAHAPTHAEEDDDEFAKELQRGMEALMRELVPGPPLGPPASASPFSSGAGQGTEEEIKAQERAFKAAWEAMLVEGMDGMVPDGAGAGGAAAAFKGNAGKKEGPAKKDDFAAGIRATIDKLKESESGFKDSTPAAGGSDPFDALMAQLSAGLGVGEGDGEGGDSEEDLQSMLEQMMSSLMSRDVLYEPLKELADKYPAYLSSHPALPAADRARYEAQRDVVGRIVRVFEAPGYSDEDEERGKVVVGLMGEMQSHGSPPAELIGDLPPGFNLGGAGALGADGMPEGCCVA